MNGTTLANVVWPASTVTCTAAGELLVVTELAGLDPPLVMPIAVVLIDGDIKAPDDVAG